MIYLVALVSITLGAVAQYFLKIGVTASEINSGNLTDAGKNLLYNCDFLIGVICYGVSLLLWLFVLSRLELSKAYPMVSLGYVIAMFLGYFLLGESINIMKIAGLLLIIVGVIFITRS